MLKLLSLSLLALGSTVIFNTSYGQIDTKNYYTSLELFEEAADFFVNEDYDRAYDIFMKVNVNDTAYFDARRRAVECAATQQKYDTVIQICTEVIASKKLNPYREFFFTSVGDGHMNHEDYKEAIEFLDGAIEEFSRSAHLRYNRARAHYKLEEYDEAIVDVQGALRYNPKYSSAHYLLGLICGKAGKYSRSALAFNMAIFVNPSSNSAYRAIGALEDLYGGRIEEEIDKINFVEEEDFSETDLLIENKLAENAKYKVKSKLNYLFIRHNQLLFEKIEYIDGDNGFWNQNYVHFFKQMYDDGHFEMMSYFQCLSIEEQNVQSLIAKKKTKIIAFRDLSKPMLTEMFNDRVFLEDGDYVENNLRHLGDYGFDEEGDVVDGLRKGFFKGYDDNGLINSEGTYNSEGKLEGNTKFYELGILEVTAEFSNGVLEGDRVSYYGNGAKYKIIPVKDGNINGSITSYYGCNQIYSVIPYNDEGAKEGEGIYYYSTGEVSYKINYKDGHNEGKYVEYYRNGQERELLTFVDGKKEGAVKMYNKNGEVYLEGQYEAGKAVGYWKYYYDNKQLIKEGDFKDGNRVGIWKEFNRLGILEDETDFGEKGTKTGIYKSYDLDGNLVLELEYKGEEVSKYTTYAADGTVLNTDEKKKRELDFIGFHDNGAKRIEGKYYKGNEFGKWKHYNLQETLIKEITYNEDGYPEGKANWYFDNGEIEIIKNFSKGYLDGYYVEYYRNGKIYRHGWYKEGDMVGQWDYYYRDGQLKSTEYHLQDEYHGDVVSYDEKGLISEKSNYYYGNYMSSTTYDTLGNVLSHVDMKDGAAYAEFVGSGGNFSNKKNFKGGRSHGNIEGFYSDGSTRYTGQYIFGSKHGDWKWYHRNGTLASAGAYYYGDQVGDWKWYHENAKLSTEKTYVKGTVEGKVSRYYDNGKIRSEKNRRNGELHGTTTYYAPTGEIKYIRYYDDGFMLGYSYLGSNGKPVKMIEFNNTDGAIEAFYQNGKKSYYSEYKNGYSHGKTIHYHVNGKILSERVYLKDQLDGVYKSYYANGKLREESNYTEGNRSGAYTEFYENGKKKYVENYVLDELYGWAEYYDTAGKLSERAYYYSDRKVK